MKQQYNSQLVKVFGFFISLVLMVTSFTATAESGNTIVTNNMDKNTVNIIGFLEVIESIHSVTSESEKAAILQIQLLEELYKKQKAPGKAILAFQEILDSSTNQTIRNVAYAKLSEALKRSGKSDEAEKLLKKALSENLSKLK